jgi:uncharacterized protein (DUF885 family)
MSPPVRQSIREFALPTQFSRRQAALMLGGAAIAPATTPLFGAIRKAPPCPITNPLDTICDRVLEQTPEIATYGGVPTALNGGRLARRMDDYSPEGEEAWRTTLAEAGIAIEQIGCSGDPLSELRLKISAAVIENGTRTAAIGYGRPNPFWFSGHEPYLVSQISGPHINTPNVMIAQQALSSPIEVDAWIAKLDSFAPGFAGVVEKVKADEAHGCIPPKILIEKTLPVLDSFLNGPADAHPLIVGLRDRMATAGLDGQTRAAAEKRAITALDKRARPAIAKLRAHMADLATRGRGEAGVWAQQDGAALYAANIASAGDSHLSPDEIHRIGLDQVRLVSSRIDARLKQMGLSKGTIRERLDTLTADPRQQFADSDAGRAALLGYLRSLIVGMEARQPQFLPAAMIPTQHMEVRPVPVATQDGAPGGYYDGPSLDGSRPGIYWINLRDMKGLPRYKLPTLSYHEGVPGHHTQGATSLSLPQAPMLLRIASFNAYQEGWALYAERMAADLGAYKDDPAGDIGRLADDLFRCVRLVADTGLHHLRWSREATIAYMQANTGSAMSEIVAEVERYMAWPGQALGYKLGQLRLIDMRDRFARRMGRKYDLREFNARVLANGAIPLDLLETVVLPTVAKRKG